MVLTALPPAHSTWDPITVIKLFQPHNPKTWIPTIHLLRVVSTIKTRITKPTTTTSTSRKTTNINNRAVSSSHSVETQTPLHSTIQIPAQRISDPTRHTIHLILLSSTPTTTPNRLQIIQPSTHLLQSMLRRVRISARMDLSDHDGGSAANNEPHFAV